MFTLENFYHSKQWEKLVSRLRLERVNDEGQLICAHCGKPITKRYDAIGHHTIFLTEENVNDFAISLNEDLIQLVHHKCHNHIHNKLGYKKREVYLVYGSPLSGKSTYVNSVIEPGDLLIDIDRMWECVSGLNLYSKPKQLNSVVFGMRDYLLECIKYRRGTWNNAYIVGGYPLISERERICKMYGAREVFIDTDKQTCLDRLHATTDGRVGEAWERYIEQWWARYIPPLETK